MNTTKTNSILSLARGVMLAVLIASVLTVYPAKDNAYASTTGAINVCNVLANSKGEILTGNLPAGTFSVAGRYNPESAFNTSAVLGNLLPTTSWNTTADFTLNADLIGNDGVKDASCVSYTNLENGTYRYDEETLNTSVWSAPRYADMGITKLSDASLYNSTAQADGVITLTETSNVRTLVVVNTVKDNFGTKATSIICKENSIVSKITGKMVAVLNSVVSGTKKMAYVAWNSVKDISIKPALATGSQTVFNISGTQTAYSVDFGDGSASVSGIGAGPVSHAYNRGAGSYRAHISSVGNGNLHVETHIAYCNANVTSTADATGQDVSADIEIDATSFCEPNHAPVAVITAPSPVYAGNSVTLDGTASTDAEGPIASYTWTFGEGVAVTTTTATIPHTYTTPGTYTATLVVTDANGATSNTATVTITVLAKPICGDGIDNDGDGKTDFPLDPGCSSANDNDETDPIVTVLPVCSDGKDNDADGKIDFPLDPGCSSATDNDETDATPVNHAPVISIVGEHPFNFTVGGTFDPLAHATTTDPDGDVVTLTVASNSVVPGTVGTYTVIYNAVDSHGLPATPVTLIVNVTPVVTQCNDGKDNDGDGKIDFPLDPGCSSANDNDETDPIVPPVLLPACSDGKDNDADGKIDIVDPACHTDGDINNPNSYTPNLDSENSAPIAVLAVTPGSALTNATITDDGSASSDLDGTIVLYTWNFGDGSTATSTTATITHVYPTAGTYTVTLTVKDNSGAISAPVTKNVVISNPSNGGGGSTTYQCNDGIDNDGDGKIDATDPTCHSDHNPNNPASYTPTLDTENIAPVAVLAVTPGSALTNATIADDGSASTDVDGTIVLYTWNFGDGATATSTTSNITHVYPTAGTYTVTLTVKDNSGATSTAVSKTVTISNPSNGGGGGGTCGQCGSTTGGGGAVIVPATPALVITNEKVEKGNIPGISIVSWTTNLPSDSRVVYGTSSVSTFPIGDQKYGYPNTTVTVTDLVTTHSIAVGGINPNLTNYFRPISRTSTLSATGIELSQVPTTCYYLRDFLKYGDANNDPIEVKKLQAFLNEFDGAHLTVSGFFDIPTRDAVDHFQDKYKIDVLDPWGHKAPTGYVYLTTRKQVNEIYCRSAFPLDGNQTAEVIAFRKLLESLQNNGVANPVANGNDNQIDNNGGLVQGATDNTLNEGDKTPSISATNTDKTGSVTTRGNITNMFASALTSLKSFSLPKWNWNTDTCIPFNWLWLVLLAIIAGIIYKIRKMMKGEVSATVE